MSRRRDFSSGLNLPDKNWKFSEADVRERAYWDDYTAAFEDMLSHTSTAHAPWHIIPADQKWFARLAVANIIVSKLASLKVEFPQLDGEQMKGLASAKQLLDNEK